MPDIHKAPNHPKSAAAIGRMNRTSYSQFAVF